MFFLKEKDKIELFVTKVNKITKTENLTKKKRKRSEKFPLHFLCKPKKANANANANAKSINKRFSQNQNLLRFSLNFPKIPFTSAAEFIFNLPRHLRGIF